MYSYQRVLYRWSSILKRIYYLAILSFEGLIYETLTNDLHFVNDNFVDVLNNGWEALKNNSYVVYVIMYIC